jgi:hypothetical protein
MDYFLANIVFCAGRWPIVGLITGLEESYDSVSLCVS